MYRKLLPVLFSVALTTRAFAQAPTLTAANISPALNDSFESVVCNPAGVSPGASGASVIWNFSGLVTTTDPDSVNIGHVVYANASVPGYSSLSTAATLISSPTFGASTHAVVTPNSSLTNFYIESSSRLSLSGVYYDASNNSLYTDTMTVLRFPFTYLNTFTDAYAGFILITGLTSPAAEAGNVTVTADAWGNLTLPPAPPSTSVRTFTGVLRVKSYQLFRDSADIFGTPFVQTDTIETYTWYQPGYHSALLTISNVRGPGINNSIVSYARKQLANHEAVPSVADIASSLKLYPNPANGLLNIEFNNVAGDKVTLSLFDILGREVGTTSLSSAQGLQHAYYNTSSLPAGVYLVSLQSGTETVTRKIEIQ